MQIGIVGLPFSGKTTLFNTVTKTHLDPDKSGRMKQNVATIKVPDVRLDRLTDIFHPEKTVNATIEILDMGGLQPGESGGVKFSTGFLASVKTNDALVQVVRCFKDDSIPHPEGSIDMLRDIRSFETEFILSDQAIVENRIEKINKQVQKVNDEALRRELPLLEKSKALLEAGNPLREAAFTPGEQAALRSYQFLSMKPLLVALNLDETQRGSGPAYLKAVGEMKKGKNTKALAFSGKIEMELAELSPGEAAAFMAEYGIEESAFNNLIREAYDLLGLQSFFTVGEDECRAWTVKKGVNAQEAAGAIHSDIAEKFIRAEVVHYDDFISHGSFAKAKESGSWRLEGKEYPVMEGDIISFRHS